MAKNFMSFHPKVTKVFWGADQIEGMDSIKITGGRSLSQIGSADGKHYAVVRDNQGTADTITLTVKTYSKDQITTFSALFNSTVSLPLIIMCQNKKGDYEVVFNWALATITKDPLFEMTIGDSDNTVDVEFSAYDRLPTSDLSSVTTFIS